MLRVVSLNMNGIRAAARKGFFEWMLDQNIDVLCLQELKAQHADLSAEIFKPKGYYVNFHCAEKKGYSGVGIYSKQKPEKIFTGLGWPVADEEGRYIQVDFKNLSIASIYLPSGTSGDIRQTVKIDFLNKFEKHLAQVASQSRDFILCGDWNIAHKAIDLKNWRPNQKHSGFLPEEREWLDNVFDTMGFIDAFRYINKDPDQYTWWSNRGQAWLKNVGWRIDYQVVTNNLKNKIKSVQIYKDQRFSDHAPLIVDYLLDKEN
ncbi:exodeoxyribonuclease III [Gammaproteobacteria bacterium]|nr:exodeoxyribonuclease III [Gammaproteobacteria bacterium]